MKQVIISYEEHESLLKKVAELEEENKSLQGVKSGDKVIYQKETCYERLGTFEFPPPKKTLLQFINLGDVPATIESMFQNKYRDKIQELESNIESLKNSLGREKHYHELSKKEKKEQYEKIESWENIWDQERKQNAKLLEKLKVYEKRLEITPIESKTLKRSVWGRLYLMFNKNELSNN